MMFSPPPSLSQLVRISMAVAIFLSYTLQFYVPVNMVEPFVRSNFDTTRAKDLAATVLRTVLVTFTCKSSYSLFIYSFQFVNIFIYLSLSLSIHLSASVFNNYITHALHIYLIISHPHLLSYLYIFHIKKRFRITAAQLCIRSLYIIIFTSLYIYIGILKWAVCRHIYIYFLNYHFFFIKYLK